MGGKVDYGDTFTQAREFPIILLSWRLIIIRWARISEELYYAAPHELQIPTEGALTLLCCSLLWFILTAALYFTLKKYIPAHYLVGEEDSAHLWILVLSLVDYGLEGKVYIIECK